MEYGEVVGLFEDFFSDKYYKKVAGAVKEGEDSIVVDFMEMDMFEPRLGDYLKENPNSAMDAAEEGVKGVDIISDEDFTVRFTNMPEEEFVLLKNLRSKHLNKFTPIEGMIKRASQVKPEVISAIFECTQCGDRYEKQQDSTELKSPYKCDCGSRKFETVEKKMTDTQNIVVEENPESREGSEQPSTLSVRLEGDLVDPDFQRKVVPGNVAEITGVLKERPLKKNSKKFDIYMEGNYLEPTQQEFEQLELTDEEIEDIKELSNDPEIFDKISRSIAPSIYGHHQIKKAIALQLFGGVQKSREDGVESRGDIHILLIGEPGTGKSQLLDFTGEIAPKGRYVVGKSATGAGLTASVVRDEQTGEFELEAGAVVLANKGMAAIDEIDKMSKEDRSSLHEAMEQQCFGPDTEVMLPDGSKNNISEIVNSRIQKKDSKMQEDGREVVELEKGPKILSFSPETSRIEKREVSMAGRRPAPEEMIEFELETGREIEVTEEHPFFVLEDGEITEKEAKQIKESDFVLSPRNMPVEGEEQYLEDINVEEKRKEVEIPEHNSPALAKFMGYQVSDGGYELNRGEKVGFNFTNTDEKLLEDYENCISELFSIDPYIRERDNRKEVRVISKELKNWLEELGPVIEKGETKAIPERLMKCRKEEHSYLLRAFFDGDGGVYNVKRGYRIRAVVENKVLIKQIQDLLLRFGIHSTVIEDGNVWRIEMNRYEDILRFKQNIGFLTQEKQERLEEAVEDIRDSKEPVPDVSPKLMNLMQLYGVNQDSLLRTNLTESQINVSRDNVKKILDKIEQKISLIERTNIEEESIDELKQFREDLKISARQIAGKIDATSSLIHYWEKNGTERIDEYKEGLKKCVEKLRERTDEVNKLSNIVENIRFLKIKNKKRFSPEYEYVYDLTVPENNSFVAENAIMHNSISVSKANIQATLNAQTSILAAGNPKLGRFDPYEPIPQQIDIGDTLLSRFDFIFPVKDEPDEDKDTKLSSQVLQNHIEPEETTAELGQEMMRKYVAYAKKKKAPDLTQEAADKIQEFYVSMRTKGSDEAGESVPITARQLEALVRVAEASARAELKDEVELEDAERAIDILTYCLKQVGVDPETGEFDIDVVESGVSSSQRNRAQTVKHLLKRMTEDGSAEMEDVLDEAEDEGLDRGKAEKMIKQLMRDGEVFEPEPGKVKMM